jgi:hypothetical protein
MALTFWSKLWFTMVFDLLVKAAERNGCDHSSSSSSSSRSSTYIDFFLCVACAIFGKEKEIYEDVLHPATTPTITFCNVLFLLFL